MKIVKVDKRGKDSLYATFLIMTLVPLLAFGLIAITFVSNRVRESTKEQVVKNLKNIEAAVENSYDIMYPGDYNILVMKKSRTLYKGEAPLSGNTELIDAIKKESGMDISLFFADLRLVTTMLDENGDRYIDVAAADRVVAEVFIGKTEMFYDNVTIGTIPYYAYYKPIFSEDGDTCIGMIGVAMPSATVNAEVMKSIYQTILILIAFMIITAFVIIRSSSKIIDIIQRILKFLRELANDNLDARLDEVVLGRKDELGEIGLASSKVQMSLKKLIERDALTGLYNRRAGERKLDNLEKQGIKSSISIGDIDFFKKFNDSFGHECGDVVLKEVAASLNEGMRGKGFVARWGGEEFLLVFENIEETAAGLMLIDILQGVRDRVIEYDGQTHSVTMTFGVVGRAEDEKVADQIRRADDKLYEGKQGGRNRVIV
ncbi:MAG: diguanylate cyclase [Lachnospiraceae bacterium]|nr:diguanylate cyclase [Lachnospiraceae bacterium]